MSDPVLTSHWPLHVVNMEVLLSPDETMAIAYLCDCCSTIMTMKLVHRGKVSEEYEKMLQDAGKVTWGTDRQDGWMSSMRC